MKSVAIIGGGVTGLTAGFCLQRKGVPVTVYEASERVGGAIRSVREGGYLAEFGPNTVLETSARISALVRDAGLESRRLDPDPKAGARYVVRYQRPIEMPMSPLGFFTTELFTASAKWAVLREPFVRPRRDGVEESIAGFVRRRLNQEFLDHAIDALVAGIYAGDPEKLSVQQAFPKLAALEENYGSLIKGQIFGAKERKRRGEIAKDRAPKFSFDEGLQVLPDTLRARLAEAVQLNAAVTKLAQTPDGWRVEFRENSQPQQAHHGAVLLAAPTFKLAELQVERTAEPSAPLTPALSPSDGERVSKDRAQSPSLAPSDGERVASGRVRGTPLSFAPFGEIRYPPVASVVLGFRREDVAHTCSGFGMLIPKIEGFKILGTIFSSSLFPNRAPVGHLTLTSYVGGERHPELASKSPEELYDLTCADLRVLLGVKGQPTFRHHYFWPRAIPQYNLGYGRYRALMTEIESRCPGLFFAGHYRDGISLGDSIVSGVNIADRIAQSLNR